MPDRAVPDGGFTLIELTIVLAVIAVIAAIAIPNILEARKSANESAAIKSIRCLHCAQVFFYEGDVDGDGPDYAATVDELSTYKLVDPKLGSGRKDGYRYEIHGPEWYSEWHGHAYPISSRSGRRYFYVNDLGVIRFKVGGEANEVDAPLQ